MAEKDSAKKRLVLLAIFVALSLIVDLLSLTGCKRMQIQKLN